MLRAKTGTSQALKWVSLENMTFLYCPIGIWIGNKTINYAVAEIICSGFKFRFTPCPVYCAGSQSGASFVGCDITAEHIPPETYLTETYPEHSVWMEGGFITVVGGSMVTDITNYPQVLLSPSNDADGNNYPTFIATGCHIESNRSQLAVIQNPYGYATPLSANSCFIINSCTGFAGTLSTEDYITCLDSSYSGLIDVTDSNMYASVVRTGYNISSTSELVRIKTDSVSLNTNFKNWMAGVSIGAKLLHGQEAILSAYGLGTQAITVAVPGVAKFTTADTTGNLSRYAVKYDSTTGQFVVPTSGFTQCQINVCLQWTGGGSIFVSVRKNGLDQGFTATANGLLNLSLSLFNLVKDDILVVWVVPTGATATFNSGQQQFFQITGSTF